MRVKIAVLIDGGLLRVVIKGALRSVLRAAGDSLVRPDGRKKQLHDLISPEDYVSRVVSVARKCIVRKFEEVYRIFYYDCEPLKPLKNKPVKNKRHPMGANLPIIEKAARDHQEKVINLMRIQPNFAVRLGEMSFQGWVPIPENLADVIATNRVFTRDDFKPDLKQKGVDLRIGIDTALLAKDHLVQRLVLLATDSDLVPAMKLARREGVQIVLADLGAPVKALLREHADLYRRPVV